MHRYFIILSIFFSSISAYSQVDSLEIIKIEAPAPIIQEQIKPTLDSDVVYGRKYGLALTMDVYQPVKANGVAIVLINSGGFLSPYFKNSEENLWGSSWMVKNANPDFPSVNLGLKFSIEDLLEEGFTIFDITHSSSPVHKLDVILKDCETAIQFIRFNASKYAINPEKIGTWGMGEGAYIALYLASIDKNGKTNAASIKETNSKANTAVAFFPTGYDYFAEISKFPFLKFGLPALEMDKDFIQSNSLAKLISPDDPPVLIVYGDQDNPFVVEPSQNIVSAYKQMDVKSKALLLKGTGTLFKGFDNKFNQSLYQQAKKEQIKWYKNQLMK